jgi:hypothetical protein
LTIYAVGGSAGISATGSANRGNGGGGGSTTETPSAGSGGSGIVIIRYQITKAEYDASL